MQINNSVQGLGPCCSVIKSCPILCNPMATACQAFLSFTISRSLFKLMSIESVMPSNHLILCHPLLLLPSTFARIKVFANESAFCAPPLSAARAGASQSDLHGFWSLEGAASGTSGLPALSWVWVPYCRAVSSSWVDVRPVGSYLDGLQGGTRGVRLSPRHTTVVVPGEGGFSSGGPFAPEP